MRISDWSSDVCSSDLGALRRLQVLGDGLGVAADRLHQLLALLDRRRLLRSGDLEADGLGRLHPGACAKDHPCRDRQGPCCLEDALALHRSEEHPSELQSLMRISYAVFCLKKKQ